MSKVLIAGGGPCGSAAALMLARDGHDVTLLERDEASPPESADEAWRDWERRGVAQFRLGHLLLARSRQILEAHIPEVVDELRAMNAVEFSFLDYPSTQIPGFESRPDDDRFVSVSARRPVIELAFDRVMQATENLTVRRGVVVSHFLTEASSEVGVPRIVGVETSDGESILADVVIDAMGRKSPTPRLLEDAGALAPAEHAVDSGFVYYGQSVQSLDGTDAAVHGPPLAHFNGYSILALPGDSGAWFIGVYASSHDKELRILRQPDQFRRLLTQIPAYAHWLDGEYIGEQAFMAGVTDRDRTFVLDGTPVAAGLLPLADAWACTNPSLGRGISIGLVHVERLRHLLKDGVGDVNQLSRDWHDDTEQHVAPWHNATRTTDQARSRQLEAERLEQPPEPDSDDVVAAVLRGFEAGSVADGDIARSFAELGSLLATSDEVLGRDGTFEKILAFARTPSRTLEAPTRREFLAGS